jgi:hypothetical protein
VTLQSAMSTEAYSYLDNPPVPPRSALVNVRWSADGRTLSMHVASPVLIGREETCATVMTEFFSRPGCSGASHDCPEDTVDTFPLAPSADRAIDVTRLGVLGFHTPANIAAAIGAYTRAARRVGPTLSRCRSCGCAAAQVMGFRSLALHVLHDYIADDIGALAPCGASAKRAANRLVSIDRAWPSIQGQLATRRLASLRVAIVRALARSIGASAEARSYGAVCGPGAAPS